VREAFKGLEAVGVIEARKGVGRFVRAFEADAFLSHFSAQMLYQGFSERELIETRCLLEVALAQDAVARLTDEDLVEIERLWARISAATAAGATSLDADLGLHRVIMSRAENRLIVAMLDAVYAFAAGRARDQEYGLDKLIEDFGQHEAIVRAALGRDGGAVRDALIAHFETTATRLGFEQRWRAAFSHVVPAVAP
jgi:DNA-binding FadR family transcriptional regulator